MERRVNTNRRRGGRVHINSEYFLPVLLHGQYRVELEAASSEKIEFVVVAGLYAEE